LAAELWNNSHVVEFLKRQGYRYVFLPTASLFDHVKDMDVRMESRLAFNRFASELINTTPLEIVLPLIYCRYKQHRNSILYAFEELKDLSNLGSPKFVYAHILLPHQPFVFDEDGNPITPDYPYSLIRPFIPRYGGEESRNKYKESYRKQLIFTNKKIMEIVDRILADSDRPPIIILQGDHGPEAYLDPSSINNTNLKERTSILNAYYFPSGSSGLYDTITPVNTFRVIFNQYFGADYDLLPDESFFSFGGKPCVFINVTDQINAQ